MKPVEPIKIGFVGLGFGTVVAERLLAGPDRQCFTLAAVCDQDAGKAAAVAARFQVKACTSLDELLADEAIPAIGLFSGPAGRADLLRRIIRAGKDVMTTKPFELDPVAARTVLEEARALGRIIHLNSPSAEPPEYIKQIRRWVEEYSLGRAISGRGEMLVPYREQADGRWPDDPVRCPVAPIFRIGIYALNDLTAIFGPVRAVQVLTSRLFTGRPTPDNAQLGLLFENEAIGSIHASFCVDNGQHYANALTLNFERGTIQRNVAPVAYGQAENSSRLRLIAVPRPGEVVEREWVSAESTGSYQWACFHRAITTRQSMEPGLEHIVNGVEVIAAMARAERSGALERVSRAN